MITPEERQAKMLEKQVEVILDLMNKSDDVEVIQALDSAYWAMMSQIARLNKQ